MMLNVFEIALNSHIQSALFITLLGTLFHLNWLYIFQCVRMDITSLIEHVYHVEVIVKVDHLVTSWLGYVTSGVKIIGLEHFVAVCSKIHIIICLPNPSYCWEVEQNDTKNCNFILCRMTYIITEYAFICFWICRIFVCVLLNTNVLL